VNLNVDSIDGLQYLDFSDLSVSTISAATGTQTCPYRSDANDSLDLSCSYSGTGRGDASITSGDELEMVVSKFQVRVKCSDGIFHPKYTLYGDGFTCKASTATGTATFGYCAGTCEASPTGALSYLRVPSKSDITLKPGDTKCDFDGSKFESGLLDDFEEVFEPLFKAQLADALKAPLKEAINSILPSLPYPADACADSSVADEARSRSRWRWRQSAFERR
jgi:hypothetical protein